ncbi:hypothetical protein Tco_1410992, partial [Tanacetum coccineum]
MYASQLVYVVVLHALSTRYAYSGLEAIHDVTTTFAIFPSDKSGVSRATCRWGYLS